MKIQQRTKLQIHGKWFLDSGFAFISMFDFHSFGSDILSLIMTISCLMGSCCFSSANHIREIRFFPITAHTAYGVWCSDLLFCKSVVSQNLLMLITYMTSMNFSGSIPTLVFETFTLEIAHVSIYTFTNIFQVPIIHIDGNVVVSTKVWYIYDLFLRDCNIIH